ncbi:uncharacterized protein METZ01_LOCUS446828 [marine metagenome]|uniref:Sel1 repeat family protein n=1 Tax=marine metagenome TaxID=408172 RepID=A0A382ZEL2_9ZZZZ
MKTKPTLLLSLTFLFLFSGSSVVFGDDFQDEVQNAFQNAEHIKGYDAEKRGDYQEALKWYQLAADQGIVNAFVSLGRMYHDGRGIPKDSKEASKWFRLAAEKGSAGGQEFLGLMYQFGVGVPKD